MTQQGEISAVTSPSPLGCELATDPAPGAQKHSLAPGCRHWQEQAENGLRQSKRTDLASGGKIPLEKGRQGARVLKCGMSLVPRRDCRQDKLGMLFKALGNETKLIKPILTYKCEKGTSARSLS